MDKDFVETLELAVSQGMRVQFEPAKNRKAKCRLGWIEGEGNTASAAFADAYQQYHDKYGDIKIVVPFSGEGVA